MTDSPDSGSRRADPTTLLLLRAARRGDRDALEALFRRYLPRVRRIVALRMGQRLLRFHAVEDVVQQALLRVFRSLERFEERSEGSFRNWIARCVENEVVDLSRRGKAQKRDEGRLLLVGGDPYLLSSTIIDRRRPPVENPGERAELESRVEEALLALPLHHREIIILRHLCEMSHREIAAELGFEREVNSRLALSRAMKRLRAALGL